MLYICYITVKLYNSLYLWINDIKELICVEVYYMKIVAIKLPRFLSSIIRKIKRVKK
ncbi:stage V sporulation protein SpoVM [Clostridium botulinum]|nr:stage V sporulation protein SpoVM [Clostridium botulinum]